MDEVAIWCGAEVAAVVPKFHYRDLGALAASSTMLTHSQV
jgi:hypothetical protein